MVNYRFLLCILSLMVSLLARADKYDGFPAPEENFDQHIKAVETYLLRTQMQQRTPEDVRYNLPFEIPANGKVPYKGKFLLIHGLNDSPYVFVDVARQLTERGFDVRAVLLPGHGSSPEAQLAIKSTDWLTAARDQLKVFRGDDNIPVFLGGFSLGAVIATVLALENDDVRGLLLFSPAYKSSMNHLLRWSYLYSKFKPWVFGGMIIEDNPTKYNSIPINGAAQYYNTTKYLKRLWGRKKLAMPTLVVASVDDSVVDIEHMKNTLGRRFNHADNKLILYSNDASVKNDDKLIHRSSRYEQQRVLNQSHQSVLMSPDNALFGANGTVLVCNGNDWPTFSACLYSKQQHWFGAQHTPSPDGVPVARATYNPDFNFVFSVFDQIF